MEFHLRILHGIRQHKSVILLAFAFVTCLSIKCNNKLEKSISSTPFFNVYHISTYNDLQKIKSKPVAISVYQKLNSPGKENLALKNDFLSMLRFDLIFPLTYLLFGWLLLSYGNPNKYLKFFFYLLAVAMLSDYGENISMYMVLIKQNIQAFPLMTFLNTFKSYSILSSILGILYVYPGYPFLSDRSIKYLKIIWANRLIVFVQLIIYMITWIFPLGIDLLINLNAHWAGPTLYFTLISIIAVMSWHLPKYYNESPANSKLLFTNVAPLPDPTEKIASRLFGAITFLVPIFGILHAGYAREISIHGFIAQNAGILCFLSIIITGFILMKMEYHLRNEKPSAKYNYMVYSANGGGLAILLILWFNDNHAPQHLWYISAGLTVCMILFLVNTTLRTKTTAFNNFRISTWVIIPAFIASSVFLILMLMNLIHSFQFQFISFKYLTLPLLYTGFCFYLLLFSVLLMMGKKYNLKFLSILIIVSLLTAVFFDNRFHDVRTYKSDKKHLATLKEYFRQWIIDRKDDIVKDTSGNYPLVIVISHGGGIKAAAWTALTINYIRNLSDSNLLQVHNFQEHLFAYSGVSGGTVGGAINCLIADSSLPNQAERDSLLTKTFSYDYLTPLLIGLMGNDLIYNLTGFSLAGDRVTLLEESFEKNVGVYFGSMSTDFYDLWYNNDSVKTNRPLLFANTFNVNSGSMDILAPVTLDSNYFINQTFISDELQSDKLEYQSMRLSTAAILSARFPLLSSSGKLFTTGHYLDGGLKEYSGAMTAYELKQALTDYLKDTAFITELQQGVSDLNAEQIAKRINIHYLDLPNSYPESNPPCSIPVYSLVNNSMVKARSNLAEVRGNPEKKNLFEPFGALKGLVNSPENLTAACINRITIESSNPLNKSKIIEIRPSYLYLTESPDLSDSDKYIFSVLPLGWQLTDYDLKTMHYSLLYQKDSIIHKINSLSK